MSDQRWMHGKWSTKSLIIIVAGTLLWMTVVFAVAVKCVGAVLHD